MQRHMQTGRRGSRPDHHQDKGVQCMCGLHDALCHTLRIDLRRGREPLWMRMPVTNIVQPALKPLENFCLLGGPIRSIGQPTPAVAAARASCLFNNDAITIKACEELTASLTLGLAYLAMALNMVEHPLRQDQQLVRAAERID